MLAVPIAARHAMPTASNSCGGQPVSVAGTDRSGHTGGSTSLRRRWRAWHGDATVAGVPPPVQVDHDDGHVHIGSGSGRWRFRHHIRCPGVPLAMLSLHVNGHNRIGNVDTHWEACELLGATRLGCVIAKPVLAGGPMLVVGGNVIGGAGHAEGHALLRPRHCR